MDRAVVDFGAERRWSAALVKRAKRICYRTVWTECHWRLYANVGVPGSIDYTPNDGYPSHGGDKNSVGLYQQRSQWWGDTKGSMDSYVSTQRFLTGMLRNSPDWAKVGADGSYVMDESDICQRTQGSQFDGVTIDPRTGKPFPYAQNYRDESASTDALEADLTYFTKG